MSKWLETLTPAWIILAGIVASVVVYFFATGMFFAYEYWTEGFVCIGN